MAAHDGLFLFDGQIPSSSIADTSTAFSDNTQQITNNLTSEILQAVNVNDQKILPKRLYCRKVKQLRHRCLVVK